MVNKNTSKNLANKGFTIIEILVVVTIIGILAIMGTIKRKESLQRKQAEIEALQIKQMVELARDYALTGEVITVGSEEFVPNYFQFEIEDTGEYKINALDDSSPAMVYDIDHGKELPTGEISSDNVRVNSNATVTYKVPYADCDFPPSSRITVCGGDGNCTHDPSNSLNYTITINNAGSVSIE
ncbi:MAG: type II secretion system protein [Patescibacteria group bacterium]|nr:type II secretion system protein [Patescibacteria group bacterium]